MRNTALLAVFTTMLVVAACGPPGGGGGPSGIEEIDRGTFSMQGHKWEAVLYRNNDVRCGKPDPDTGEDHFTFAVIEPEGTSGAQATGTEASLWVYLHGGGIGYYDTEVDPDGGEEVFYVGDEENNFAEDLQTLVTRAGSPGDTILMRRLMNGWRVLAPTMCDHDLHAGEGQPYPDNPNYGEAGDTVDGLLANKAALRWVAENRPTKWVVAHGTSAGAVGVFALAESMHAEGVDLNAAIMDAYLVTERLQPLFDAGLTPQQAKTPDFDTTKSQEKVGRFSRYEPGPDGEPYTTPEKLVTLGDFRAVPLLDVVGDQDKFCAGQIEETIPGIPAGENKCEWVHGGFADAVAAQAQSAAGSPHGTIIVEGGGHSTTKDVGSAVHDEVDDWLAQVITPGSPRPFG